jgi:hypothetical protein
MSGLSLRTRQLDCALPVRDDMLYRKVFMNSKAPKAVELGATIVQGENGLRVVQADVY